MTPYELGLHSEVFGERMKFEQDRNTTFAYLTAYLHRVENMPRLEDLLNDKPAPKVMSDAEMLEVVKTLNATFGGTIEGGTVEGGTAEQPTKAGENTE